MEITCSVSPCVIQLQVSHPLLDMTPEQGAEIGFAIVAVWAVGVVFRLLSQLLKDDGVITIERD